MILPTVVYTANRGYAWSNAVEGVPEAKLNQLYRFISTARGDFPNPWVVEAGLVSDGAVAAVFTIQNIDNWDSENRSSDYAAFAFFPVAKAADIDFIDLLNNDFFWTPSRTPQTSLDYLGKQSEKAPPLSSQSLETSHVCLLRNPRAVGDILAQHGHRSGRWVCLMKAENTLKIECNSWN